MPTVPIRKDLLFKRIGKEFTEEEFDDFTFDFGLEIDDKVRLSEIEESSSGNTEEEDVRVRDFVVIDTLLRQISNCDTDLYLPLDRRKHLT